jgi:hypothetical protein
MLPGIQGIHPVIGAAAATSSPPGTPVAGLVGGNIAITNNTAATPANPTHQSGDTLLCIAMVRSNTAASLAVSGAGWTNATGISGVRAFGTDSIQFFMNECDSSTEANPTVTPSGGASGQTVIATVVRIRGRTFGTSFALGTISVNAATTNTIRLAQNSPSIAVGDAILAIGLKTNDGGAGGWNTISGMTAGLTWGAVSAAWNSSIGNDESGRIFGAVNNSGGAYTAGTGASILGQTLTGAHVSAAVYLKIAAS